jgi:hypothetical protein
MKSKFVLTATDAFLICSPILILFFIIVSEGIEPSDILKKPEWSFVSVLLLVESFRDFGKVWRNRGEHEEQIDSGYAFTAILLVLATLVLIIDFRHFIGKAPFTTELVYWIKFVWFGFSVLLFSVTRWQRHAI